MGLERLKRPEVFDARVWRVLHGLNDQARVAAIVDPPWDGTVLEIGSGRGYVACQVAASAERVIALEPVAEFRAQAEALAAENGITNVQSLDASGESIPLPDRHCDGVIISEVLEHIEDPLPVLREAARVLKADASLLVTVPQYGALPPGVTEGHVHDFTAVELEDLISRAGLVAALSWTVAIYQFVLCELVRER